MGWHEPTADCRAAVASLTSSLYRLQAIGALPCSPSAIGVPTTWGIAAVNSACMVKPLCEPYNDLHRERLTSMLQGEELANIRTGGPGFKPSGRTLD
jgi:hypothetical protein